MGVGWGGGLSLSIFAHKEVSLKPRADLSIDSNDVEPLCIETHHKRNKNISFNVMCRPPNSDMAVFENFLENTLSGNDKPSKNIIFAGD